MDARRTRDRSRSGQSRIGSPFSVTSSRGRVRGRPSARSHLEDVEDADDAVLEPVHDQDVPDAPAEEQDAEQRDGVGHDQRDDRPDRRADAVPGDESGPSPYASAVAAGGSPVRGVAGQPEPCAKDQTRVRPGIRRPVERELDVARQDGEQQGERCVGPSVVAEAVAPRSQPTHPLIDDGRTRSTIGLTTSGRSSLRLTRCDVAGYCLTAKMHAGPVGAQRRSDDVTPGRNASPAGTRSRRRRGRWPRPRGCPAARLGVARGAPRRLGFFALVAAAPTERSAPRHRARSRARTAVEAARAHRTGRPRRGWREPPADTMRSPASIPAASAGEPSSTPRTRMPSRSGEPDRSAQPPRDVARGDRDAQPGRDADSPRPSASTRARSAASAGRAR